MARTESCDACFIESKFKSFDKLSSFLLSLVLMDSFFIFFLGDQLGPVRLL